MAGPSDYKTEKVAGLIRSMQPGAIRRLLVVGCGDGNEAAVLARELDADVFGVDLKDDFDAEASKYADLRLGDAESLAFDDSSFDLVYSYHALEHIARPQAALQEIRRVLRPGGGAWIGTPNRSRLVGYIGSADASLKQKLRWNAADWRARLSGRFRNDLGAHAGFTSAELSGMLGETFDEVVDVSDRYFRSIYDRYRPMLSGFRRLKATRFVYPSIYFFARKAE